MIKVGEEGGVRGARTGGGDMGNSGGGSASASTNTGASQSSEAAKKPRLEQSVSPGKDVSSDNNDVVVSDLNLKVFRMLKSKGALDGTGRVMKAVTLTEDEEDLVGDVKTLLNLQKIGVVAVDM
jgi:hypothetical protein